MTQQAGVELLWYSASSSHPELFQKDTMVNASKSCQEIKEDLQGCTPPVSLQIEVIKQGRQGCFSAKTRPEAGLAWIHITCFLQVYLQLVSYQPLSYLPQ